jgi:CRP-like cAMP-binding protein
MVSPELIRRYKYFSGLNHEQITILSKTGNEFSFDEGHYFFHEEEELHNLFLIIDGNVSINLEITDREESQSVSKQLIGELKTREIKITTLGVGDVFGISALIPPNISTTSAKADTSCRVILFDCGRLMEIFESNHYFGYLMTQKAAQVVRERLRNLYIENIVNLAK